ncbi:hypothetical protein LTR17_009073 [Elasticomyces elasticus]|nr:hypothetical protein LTR17_009073 [Elasticomyces elasticus]
MALPVGFANSTEEHGSKQESVSHGESTTSAGFEMESDSDEEFEPTIYDPESWTFAETGMDGGSRWAVESNVAKHTIKKLSATFSLDFNYDKTYAGSDFGFDSNRLDDIVEDFTGLSALRVQYDFVLDDLKSISKDTPAGVEEIAAFIICNANQMLKVLGWEDYVGLYVVVTDRKHARVASDDQVMCGTTINGLTRAASATLLLESLGRPVFVGMVGPCTEGDDVVDN